MLITDKEQLKAYGRAKCYWHGIPSIEVTKKGRTFLTFYSGGTKEELGNFAALVMSDDGVNYTDPVAVAYVEGYRCFDPCAWIDPLGRLWFTWSKCPDDGLYAAICDDPDAPELVFGEPFLVGHNVMMNKPTVLSTGEWAFPIAVWNHGVRVIAPQYDSPIEPKGSYMYVTADCGKTFRQVGYADVQKRSFDEHMFLELESGVIRCFVRTTYGIGASDSYDGGVHWGKDFDTGYKGPCSRFHIRRLPSGRVLLINHYDYSGRNNLTAMLSEDDGKTFPYRLLLDERRAVAYPDAALDAEGRIHICYDRERGAFRTSYEEIMGCARELLTACIREEDILAGKIESQDSFLKRVAYKLTDYQGDLVNPFQEDLLFTDSAYAKFLQDTCTDAQQILTRVFNVYQISCSNLHNIQAEQLDAAIEAYSRTGKLEDLDRIVAIVRSAHGQGEYTEKGIVDEICRYVVEHPECDCSTESIAKRFHFSTHYLRHAFKKQTGTTISDFKTAQLIKKAKLLLRMSEHKITDIAAACGFDSPSYFTEVFIKEVGMSPSQYRRG